MYTLFHILKSNIYNNNIIIEICIDSVENDGRLYAAS